ncbi:MAG: SH3 domain-containing protein [Pararhodobacter sp.]
MRRWIGIVGVAAGALLAQDLAAQQMTAPPRRPASLAPAPAAEPEALAAAVAAAAATAAGAGVSPSTSAATAPAANAPAAAAPVAAPAVGPETGLPLPRFVSLKTSTGRARRGPSDSHRVDWVYMRRDLPLRVTGEFEHWRRVEDSEGEGGWVHYSLLSGVRTVLVTRDMAPLQASPMPGAPEVAYLEAGVVARIMTCTPHWCRLSVDGSRGWIDRGALWGVEPDEVLN